MVELKNVNSVFVFGDKDWIESALADLIEEKIRDCKRKVKQITDSRRISSLDGKIYRQLWTDYIKLSGLVSLLDFKVRYANFKTKRIFKIIDNGGGIRFLSRKLKKGKIVFIEEVKSNVEGIRGNIKI